MQAAIACSSCHNLIDGRVNQRLHQRRMRLMHAEGVFRTQEIWRKKGHL
ncbi:nuclease domain-containing protein [Escherichia coli]